MDGVYKIEMVGQSPRHLYSEFDGIVFGETFEQGFKQYTLSAFGNYFGCRNNLDAVFAEDGFIMCAIVPVPSELIKLPDYNDIEKAFDRLLHHTLKTRALYCLCTQGTINERANNSYTLTFCKSFTLAQLPFN